MISFGLQPEDFTLKPEEEIEQPISPLGGAALSLANATPFFGRYTRRAIGPSPVDSAPAPTTPGTGVARMASGLTRGVGEALGTAAVVASTGGAAAVPWAMGALGATQTADDLQYEGRIGKPYAAAQIALGGLMGFAGAKVGQAAASERMRQIAEGTPAAIAALKEVGKNLAVDAPDAFAQTALYILSDNPDMSLGEFISEMKRPENLRSTALQAGIATAIGSGMDAPEILRQRAAGKAALVSPDATSSIPPEELAISELTQTRNLPPVYPQQVAITSGAQHAQATGVDPFALIKQTKSAGHLKETRDLASPELFKQISDMDTRRVERKPKGYRSETGKVKPGLPQERETPIRLGAQSTGEELMKGPDVERPPKGKTAKEIEIEILKQAKVDDSLKDKTLGWVRVVKVNNKSILVKTSKGLNKRRAFAMLTPGKRLRRRVEPTIKFQIKPDSLGFVSPLAKAIDGMKQDSFSPEQLKGALGKTPGVKQEELADLGFDDWLDGLNGKVTKKQALEFVKNKGPELVEVDLSNKEAEYNYDKELSHNYNTAPMAREEAIERAEKEVDAIKQSFRDEISRPEYNEETDEWDVWLIGDRLKSFKTEEEAEAEIKKDLEWIDNESAYVKVSDDRIEVYKDDDGVISRLEQVDAGGKYKDYSFKDAENYREVLIRAPNIEGEWKSTHWDESNILAHLRLADHKTKEGKKVLLVEEIQSGLHQAGRKVGYGGGVPDAPFKKSWAMLAFKRALRMASEKDYDAVAWTPGQAQVDRYNLSKKVNNLLYTRDGVLMAYGEGNKILIREKVSEEKVVDYVGAEVARKLLDKPIISRDGIWGKYLAGPDLSVGGKGMKGFYDRKLKSEIGKYIKKLDKSARVGVAEIKAEGGTQVWNVPISEKMRSAVMSGQALYQVKSGQGKRKAATNGSMKARGFNARERRRIARLLPGGSWTDEGYRVKVANGEDALLAGVDRITPDELMLSRLRDQIRTEIPELRGENDARLNSIAAQFVEEGALGGVLTSGIEIRLGDGPALRGDHIALLSGEGDATSIPHEVFHIAEQIALTPDEIRALEKTYGDEEARAQAFGDFVSGREKNPILSKIREFFRRLVDAFRKTDAAKARAVFRRLENGGAVGGQKARIGSVLRGAPREPRRQAAFQLRRKKKDAGFRFKDKAFEKRVAAAEGFTSKEPYLARAKRSLVRTWDNMTRPFAELERGGKFARATDALRRMTHRRGQAHKDTLRAVENITEPLKGPEDFRVFQRFVLLADLAETARKDPLAKLPYGLESYDEVKDKLAEVISAKNALPQVSEAVKRRKAFQQKMSDEYLKSASELGIDLEVRFGRMDYFRHVVMDYALNRPEAFAGDPRLRAKLKRGWLRTRQGGGDDISANYLEVESQVAAQMLSDTRLMQLMKKIEKDYSKWDELAKKAEQQNAGKPESKHITPTDLIPDGHTIWQPNEGNILYTGMTVPEKEAMERFKLNLPINPATLKKVAIVGPANRQWIIPERLANTLNTLGKFDEQSIIGKAGQAVTRPWKIWQLQSPTRLIKYNLRNQSEIDKVLAGNPRSLKRWGEAAKSLYKVIVKGEDMPSEMRAWFELGGVESLSLAQEGLRDFDSKRAFKRFSDPKTPLQKILGAPGKANRFYWEKARKYTNLREAILRYANFIEYKAQMDADSKGLPLNYGGSRPDEVIALESVDERAFKLSNELLGAYDTISVLGRDIRKSLIPFWSFQETNMRTYWNLVRNAWRNDEVSENVGNSLMGKASISRIGAVRLGRLALQASAFFAGLQAWNNLVMGDEEDDLPEDVRALPHLTLGRDKDGNVRYFTRLGTSSDILEWLSLDDAPQDLAQILDGRKTLTEMAKEMIAAPGNKFVNALTPLIKLPAEMLTGKALYPQALRVDAQGKFRLGGRQIVDMADAVAGQFGVHQEFRALSGRPLKKGSYWSNPGRFFAYKSDPLETSYWNIQDAKRRFLEERGEGRTFSGSLTAKSKALRYYKMSLRYNDKDAARKYLLEYFALGGTKKGMEQSLKALDPLFGLNAARKKEFLRWLKRDERFELVRAQRYHREVLGAR